MKLAGKTILGICKFNTLESALRSKKRERECNVYSVLMHGDDGLFWLVPGRFAKFLEQHHYERCPIQA